MNVIMTITSKGQVTLPKKLREQLGVDRGDRLIAKTRGKKVTLEPVGRGILDLAGKLGKLKVPKGKTVDDLINEAAQEIAAKNVLGKDIR